MDIYKTNLFPFVCGDALVGKTVKMTIKKVVIEKVFNKSTKKDEDKVMLLFEQTPKPLILNKTNAKRLGKKYGRETDQWPGHVVELYSKKSQLLANCIIPSGSIPLAKKCRNSL